jgi:hypothetical protein
LALEQTEEYTNSVRFNLHRFIEYLFTQSNLTATLRTPGTTPASVRDWLEATLTEVFGEGEQSLRFGGYIWYLRRL